MSINPNSTRANSIYAVGSQELRTALRRGRDVVHGFRNGQFLEGMAEDWGTTESYLQECHDLFVDYMNGWPWNEKRHFNY